MTLLVSGTTGVNLVTDGSITPIKLSQPMTLMTAVNTTSGTLIDFTGIPSWVKRVTMIFNGVSTNGTSIIQLQLGTSGGVVGTGYAYTVQGFNGSGTLTGSITTGAVLFNSSLGSISNLIIGTVVCTLISGTTWVINHTVSVNANAAAIGGGNITLGAPLTTMRLTTTSGTDIFDAGSVNVMYEG